MTIVASPTVSTDERARDGRAAVSLDKNTVAVPADGRLDLRVTVALDGPTSYIESRVRVHRPSGRLLYQETFVENDVTTRTVVFEYERALGDLGLSPGIYPLEVRVRSDDGEVRERLIRDSLLVFDADGPAVPLVLVAQVDCVPMTDPEGRFVIDPAATDALRTQVESYASMAIADRDVRLCLAIAPMMLEEWADVSDGYEVVEPQGLRTVGAEDPTASRYRHTLALLRSAVDSGRLELLRVPYADPDVAGLDAVERTDDLVLHLERGEAAVSASVQATPSAGALVSGGVLTEDTAAVLGRTGVAYAILQPPSLDDTSTPSGYRSVAGTRVGALVADKQASDALARGDVAGLAKRVFERAVSDEPTSPITAVLRLTPASDADITVIETAARELGGSPWVRWSTASDVAVGDAEPVALASSPRDTGAPADYWNSVREARAWAEGLTAALGAGDALASAASDDSLIAESRCWAGPDGSWALADRGRSFAASARRQSESVLRRVEIVARNVTLSSARGEVPLSVNNSSERRMLVNVRLRAEGLAVRSPTEDALVLTPTENYITVPVDLKSSLAGRLRVEVWAGSVMLDSTEVQVRASFLDRLAVIGGIVTVLAGILLYIVRRSTRAQRLDTIHPDEERGSR